MIKPKLNSFSRLPFSTLSLLSLLFDTRLRHSKASSFLPKPKTLRSSKYKRHQGEQEKARRRFQIDKGIIPKNQLYIKP